MRFELGQLSRALRATLLCLFAAGFLAACSDSNTEIANAGNTGDNPGTGGGDSGGGDNGGDDPGDGGDDTAESCPAPGTVVTVGGGEQCQLSGTLTADFEMRADTVYALSGPLFVGEPANSDGTGGTSATLTIEAGTTIFGENPESVLVITRGSQIQANGTAQNPIIMTSAEDLGLSTTSNRPIHTGLATDDPNTGEWGGLVINGLAPLNSCSDGICESQGEGDSGPYGGNDPDDSSGTLRYVQVKYAGNIITGEDELNGIAFQAVGRGTTIEFIHVHNGADDGVEFFGGTAEARYVVITGADDDSLDWTEGWQGKLQYLVIVQNPN